jgi:hypothetical protein
MIPQAAQDNTAILRVVRADASGVTSMFKHALHQFEYEQNAAFSSSGFFAGMDAGQDWRQAPLPFKDGAKCVIRNCTNTLCGAGFYLDDSRGVCEPCPQGTHMHEDNHQILSCEDCEPGLYSLVSPYVCAVAAISACSYASLVCLCAWVKSSRAQRTESPLRVCLL